MDVAEVEVIPVRVPIKPKERELGLAPYVSNHGHVTDRDRVLVRLETSNGVVGWGEMLGAMGSVAATAAVLESVVVPELIGHPVEGIRSFVESFYHPYVKIDPFLGAVETAMWDALGNERDESVSTMLGGRVREAVDVAYCVGILDPEESREHVRRALDHGFSALKTKAGHDWRVDVERMVAMDDEAGGRLDLRLDPNQGWSYEDAVRVGARLEDAGVYLQYLEQPVRYEAYGTYKRLRERLRQPIAVNEDTYFAHHLHHLVGEDAIDVACIDIVPAGGILRAKDQAAVAADAGVSVSHHNGFDLGVKQAAVLHTVATTPGINLAPDSVYYAWDDYLLSDPLTVEDGAIPVPEGPGLGIDVDERKVEQYRLAG
jgi:L-alanine-DL-glutamate epimerase-like enolase superfamily enzyme